MKLKRLELTNFRTFEQATFNFQPGMNLLVGINGSGKSSVLDALRKLLSQWLPDFTASKAEAIPFTKGDIMFGGDKLKGEIRLTDNRFYSICGCSPNDSGPSDLQTPLSLHTEKKWDGQRSEQPIAVYFSPHRSLPIYSDRPGRQVSDGDQKAADEGALSHRKIRVREFAEWMSAQRELREGADPIATHRLEVLQDVAVRFLEDYTKLRFVGNPAPPFISDSSRLDSNAKLDGGKPLVLLVDKGGMTLDVRQLSDGERCLLALVFDLAYRLSLANPRLRDPLEGGEAIVLIDELDLHLHPRWQRTVIEKLTTTFPNCQFIATTHSPQILGECDPAGLILLTKENGKVVVTQGRQGFGLDSSWILEHLMGATPRNVSVQQQINRVEDALENGDLKHAREYLVELRKRIHGEDSETVRLEASINNLEALADEVDSEIS